MIKYYLQYKQIYFFFKTTYFFYDKVFKIKSYVSNYLD